MGKGFFTYKRVALVGLVLALSLFIMSIVGVGTPEDTGRIADVAAVRVSKRLDILDKHISGILQCADDSPERVPDDMVIYHYVNDSLLTWNNQFPILNDRISNQLVFQRLTPVNNRLVSPLYEIGEDMEFVNLGSKWYVVKAVNGANNDKVIAGLEIKNNLIDNFSRTDNGVNGKLLIPSRYSVEPLTETSGSPVVVNETPLFKITANSVYQGGYFDNSVLKWFALLLFTIAIVIFLAGHRTLKVYFAVVPALTILAFVSYIWGARMDGSMTIFSPSIFADGTFFSLGALVIVNAYITLLCICTFLVKGRILHWLTKGRTRLNVKMVIYSVVVLACMVLVGIYAHTTLLSFINNSNVNLELYKVGEDVTYVVIVYVSYTGLLLCIPLLAQMLRSIIKEVTGKDVNFLNRRGLWIFAFICALYFSITASSLGFTKEQDRVMVWANRLAVERDLGLELQLRSVEDNIAGDQLISSLSALDNTSGMILNRITEYYLNRARQTYDIEVHVFKEGDRAGEGILQHVIYNGEPIAPGSKFLFLSDSYGRGSYAGIFMYYHPDKGLSRMIVQIKQNTSKTDVGYSRIMRQFRQPGNVNIPSFYSYAKYKNGRLSSYRGNYPYPTVPDSFERYIDDSREVSTLRRSGYVHFIVKIGDDETIMITRHQRNSLLYFTSFSYLFLVLSLLIFFFPTHKRQANPFGNNYFRTRIHFILFMSSFIILASMAAVSIMFVYKRNEANMYNVMSSKVSTVQGLMEDKTRHVKDWNELMTTAFSASLEDVSNATKSDITLYSPGGKVFRSTSPEVFERLIFGSRIDQDAFHQIRNRNQRFYINREVVAGYRFWNLYAPLLNEQGEIIAIMSIPYTDGNFEFRSEVFFHAALLINLFILLLIISLFISTRLVDALFSPLIEIGKKMQSSDIDHLEHIEYEGNDEISSLVAAYNRMVGDLKSSTKKLAQAERDKAWSQMARQVAHEIKNPLTPIKLEIQRLIRLKQNNNPKWEEKFDQVTAVILEHIQILADTANDFSTFAKLYTEDPVLIDLDKTLKEQLMIFDNKENMKFSYIGLENAEVMAPKPQLIRVFVNLITNGIQAIEIRQKEQLERGETPVEGRLLICLRNSIQEGYYDVVFDDNGPGVPAENLDKLFTPNFTTKTGGTGLGLAICRNIVEKCNGTISYQKSFSLGGASFTVTIPKL